MDRMLWISRLPRYARNDNLKDQAASTACRNDSM